MKFRKKPIEIDAIRYVYHNLDEVIQFCEGYAEYFKPLDEIRIATLEGVMTVGEGDWIIKGIAGEFYPVKSQIFDQTYEASDE